MPGSSWITAFLTHKKTRASLQRDLISGTSILRSFVFVSHCPQFMTTGGVGGAEWISTRELSNSSPLFYQTRSISLFKTVKAGELPALLFAC